MIYKNNIQKVLWVLVILVCICVCIVFRTKADKAEFPTDIPSAEEDIDNNTGSSGVIEELVTPPANKSTKITEPILYLGVTYETFYNIDLCTDFINSITASINALQEAISSEQYTAKAELAMVREVDRLSEIIEKVQADIDKYTMWESEYYYAARAYLFLRQNGYSDVVACGIIGNMMVECSYSGRSLDLNPTAYNPTKEYYGLCQWSKYYHSRVNGVSFEEQLLYLHEDMEKEFKMFSSNYKRGFTFEDFLVMKDPADAALAFAKIYERCASGSYYLREDCAEVAFEYFCGG